MKKLIVLALAALYTTVVLAKLPAASDEAKAKAAEAAVKTAWSDKVDAYLLCKSQDKVAAGYLATHKSAAKPAAALPACVDPGPFSLQPAATGSAPAAPAAAPAKKKA